MRDRIFISKSKRGGGGKSFLIFLMLLAAFVLGVFVGTKIGSFNIKIVKEEVKESVVNDQTRISHSQNKTSDTQQTRIRDPQNTIGNTQTDNQKVINELKPVITPEISPEPPKITEFTLQLAAFRGTEKAQELADELKEKGYYAYVIPVRNSKGETWHLIRMGKFRTREEAQDFAALFQEKEKMDAFVKEIDQDASLKGFGQ